MLDNFYIQNTISQFCRLYPISIDIFDQKNRLLYTSEEVHFAILPYQIEKLGQPNTTSSQNTLFLCWTQLDRKHQSFGKVIVSSSSKEQLPQICASVQIALSNVFNLATDTSLIPEHEASTSNHSVLVRSILSSHPDKQMIQALTNQMELDPSLLRAVICVNLTFKTHEYFNINLNLGYMPIINKAKSEILDSIQKNRYLTSQDLCAYYKDDEIIIIKSFIACDDISRIYLALDRICQSIEENLSSQYLLDAKIACGNIYSDLYQQRLGYQEAKETIQIGRTELPDVHIYRIENILISSICKSLSPQVINKVFNPLYKTLKRDYTDSYPELLSSFEAFADHCMNYSEAAKAAGIHRNTLNNRIVKLEQITGLKPTERFSDILLLKLFIVYIRQQARQKTQEGESI